MRLTFVGSLFLTRILSDALSFLGVGVVFLADDLVDTRPRFAGVAFLSEDAGEPVMASSGRSLEDVTSSSSSLMRCKAATVRRRRFLKGLKSSSVSKSDMFDSSKILQTKSVKQKLERILRRFHIDSHFTKATKMEKSAL